MDVPHNFEMRPGQRPVECTECNEEFAIEDGPICPHCEHDHRVESNDN